MDGLNSTTGAGRAEAAAGAAFDFRLYRYTPSLLTAIASAAVFAVLIILHFWQLYRARAFYFTAFALGGVFQTIGYCGRIWSYFDTVVIHTSAGATEEELGEAHDSSGDTMAIGGFVMQAILILVGPALYAASIYMILGRLIRTLRADHLSLLPVPWVTKIFVTGRIVSFTIQAGGGGIQAAGTLELYEIGEKIIIVGLLVRIVVFGFFIVTTILFHHRTSRKPTTVAIEGTIPWRRYLWVLYSTSLIILVRSIFRVIEYLQGNRGYLISHEIFLHIFDTILMIAVMAIFLI
ncbi:hypothetical protein CSAL01_03777 [Colletotrichum salicis]|uniref:RTA1 domain-containing protein n=1 Tax=Colletotrichum salicis TaxID=1209931 RepID=A0A135UZK9_9PEZI|nr:hypothetical protein CSAL01_03777 [Colletotrichum salicis]